MLQLFHWAVSFCAGVVIDLEFIYGHITCIYFGRCPSVFVYRSLQSQSLLQDLYSFRPH